MAAWLYRSGSFKGGAGSDSARSVYILDVALVDPTAEEVHRLLRGFPEAHACLETLFLQALSVSPDLIW